MERERKREGGRGRGGIVSLPSDLDNKLEMRWLIPGTSSSNRTSSQHSS